MRFYLAARFGRWPEMAFRTRELQAIGHAVTSRWHQGAAQPERMRNRCALSDDLCRIAQEDLHDIDQADGVILFTEYGMHFAGGRHVEAGYALALGKRLFIAGPHENVFYHLPQVVQANTWQMLLKQL